MGKYFWLKLLCSFFTWLIQVKCVMWHILDTPQPSKMTRRREWTAFIISPCALNWVLLTLISFLITQWCWTGARESGITHRHPIMPRTIWILECLLQGGKFPFVSFHLGDKNNFVHDLFLTVFQAAPPRLEIVFNPCLDRVHQKTFQNQNDFRPRSCSS